MHRRKNYQLEPVVGTSGPTDPATTGAASPSTACIDIGEATGQRRSGSNVRQLDLSKWLGHGVDPWVYACTDILRYLLQRGDRQIATIVNYGYSGVPKFLEFLSTQRHTECPHTPADLQSQHLVKFVAWIKLQYPERSTAKSVYSGLRAVLGVSANALRKIVPTVGQIGSVYVTPKAKISGTATPEGKNLPKQPQTPYVSGVEEIGGLGKK